MLILFAFKLAYFGQYWAIKLHLTLLVKSVGNSRLLKIKSIKFIIFRKSQVIYNSYYMQLQLTESLFKWTKSCSESTKKDMKKKTWCRLSVFVSLLDLNKHWFCKSKRSFSSCQMFKEFVRITFYKCIGIFQE